MVNPLLGDGKFNLTPTDKTSHNAMMIRPYLKLRSRWIELRSCWKMAFAATLLVGVVFLVRMWFTSSTIAEGPQIVPEIPVEPVDQVDKRLVKLEVYMESQCPDTTAFIEEQLWPVWQELKDSIELEVIPFGKASWHATNDGDFTFQCQHGQRECEGNQLMCCGIERLREPRLYLPYIRCVQGKEVDDTADCNRAARLSHRQMITCAKGRQGRILHQRMGVATELLSPRLHYIPWVMIEGVRTTKSLRGLKEQLCLALKEKGVEPSPCA